MTTERSDRGRPPGGQRPSGGARPLCVRHDLERLTERDPHGQAGDPALVIPGTAGYHQGRSEHESARVGAAMTTKRSDRGDSKPRLSPVATLLHISDDFIAGLSIPPLPEGVPQRLADAVVRRVQALLFHLREAKRQQYARTLEIRLVREAFGAVLTACELHLPDCEVYYATFRQLVDELGYERLEVGFTKPAP